MGLAAASAVLLGAVAQAATGFGFGLVAGPFLVALLGPELGVRQSILLASVLNVILLVSQPKGLRLRPILLMAGVSLAATPVFIWGRLLAHVDVLAGLAAVATLLGIGMVGLGTRRHWMGGTVGAIIAGAMGAVMNVVAGIAGPPAVLHALSAGWEPKSVRPSLQLYFLALNAMALSLLGLPPIEPRLGVALIAGLLLGYGIAAVVQEHRMRVATLALAGVGALAAALRALS